MLKLKAELESQRTEIVQLWQEGLSCPKICKKLSLPCGADTVRAYLKSWGIDTNHRYLPEWWGVDNDRTKAILDLRSQGKSQREVAEKFSISKERIRQIEAKNG